MRGMRALAGFVAEIHQHELLRVRLAGDDAPRVCVLQCFDELFVRYKERAASVDVTLFIVAGIYEEGKGGIPAIRHGLCTFSRSHIVVGWQRRREKLTIG